MIGSPWTMPSLSATLLKLSLAILGVSTCLCVCAWGGGGGARNGRCISPTSKPLKLIVHRSMQGVSKKYPKSMQKVCKWYARSMQEVLT